MSPEFVNEFLTQDTSGPLKKVSGTLQTSIFSGFLSVWKVPDTFFNGLLDLDNTAERSNAMTKRIVIDPVTRIEGHAKITSYLDDAGQVTMWRFHVTEFRGFERFCEGRTLFEMAGITARVCGICPVSHLLASSKAGDQILAVRPPPAAEKLHPDESRPDHSIARAFSFFHLSARTCSWGWRATRRNAMCSG